MVGVMKYILMARSNYIMMHFISVLQCSMQGSPAVSIEQERPVGGGENDDFSIVNSDDSVTIISDINKAQGGVDMVVDNNGISDSDSDSSSEDPPGPEAWWAFRCVPSAK